MPSCRFCGTALRETLVDLGMSPLCESYLAPHQLNQMEPFYPLRVYVCGECFLVQLEAYVSAEHIFSDYAYFSSYSESWVEHARVYTERMVEKFRLGPRHQVVELASNDGYLLQHFLTKGIPVVGVEPAANVADVALQKGVPTLVKFFGEVTAREMASDGRQADLLVANNVLAQVPDLNDFVKGMKTLLKADGVITLEFPHLMRLMQENQFDTIYHEHFSYFSFTVTVKILAAHGLTAFDVEELTTHGGSLRVYVRHAGDASKPVSAGGRAVGLRGQGWFQRTGVLRLLRRPSQGDQAQTAGLPHQRQARGKVCRRLRSAWQGQHAPKLLRHPRGPSGLHRGPQPPQTGQVPARNSHSCFPPR